MHSQTVTWGAIRHRNTPVPAAPRGSKLPAEGNHARRVAYNPECKHERAQPGQLRRCRIGYRKLWYFTKRDIGFSKAISALQHAESCMQYMIVLWGFPLLLPVRV